MSAKARLARRPQNTQGDPNSSPLPPWPALKSNRPTGVPLSESRVKTTSRPSLKTAPSTTDRAPSVTLLGNGQRTSWTGFKLDRETREAILYAEVGLLLPLGK
jgi:hypothetical protein